MPDPNSAATEMARVLEPVEPPKGRIIEPYLRQQLEVRRERLKTAISESPTMRSDNSATELAELLLEVDSAIQRMDAGTYGICDVCHDTIEKERLIADPLATLCLDHLSGEEQRSLERDLELAARIQRGLLPQQNLRTGDWEICFRYKPAGIVSGDYCDVISALDDRSALILVGDVAGKGVAAALLMSHLHAMFRSLSGIGLGLSRLMEMANRVFCESTFAGQYATLACARADHDGRVEIASAGHVPILRVSQKKDVRTIGSTGLPLGMFSANHYSVDIVQLEPGDSLLLFTDGISEAVSANGAEYGVDGLSSAATRNRCLLPEQMVAACVEAVEAFGAGTRQADDQTLLVMQRAGLRT